MAKFFHGQFILFVDNIMEERVNYLNFHSLPTDDAADALPREQADAWCHGFSTYYGYLNQKLRTEEDGGGVNISSRKYPLDAKELKNMLYSTMDLPKSEAFEMIDLICAAKLHETFSTDLNSESIWTPLCSEDFI